MIKIIQGFTYHFVCGASILRGTYFYMLSIGFSCDIFSLRIHHLDLILRNGMYSCLAFSDEKVVHINVKEKSSENFVIHRYITDPDLFNFNT